MLDHGAPTSPKYAFLYIAHHDAHRRQVGHERAAPAPLAGSAITVPPPPLAGDGATGQSVIAPMGQTPLGMDAPPPVRDEDEPTGDHNEVLSRVSHAWPVCRAGRRCRAGAVGMARELLCVGLCWGGPGGTGPLPTRRLLRGAPNPAGARPPQLSVLAPPPRLSTDHPRAVTARPAGALGADQP